MKMIIYIVYIMKEEDSTYPSQVPKLHKRVGEPDYTYPKATQF